MLKQRDLRDVWNQWSSKAANYSKAKNEQIWIGSHGILDINYLVWLLRKAGSNREYVAKWKPYQPITQDLAGVKQISFNEPYVSQGLNYETFAAHDTIVIKSCTGTGKTTAIAQHMESTPATTPSF